MLKLMISDLFFVLHCFTSNFVLVFLFLIKTAVLLLISMLNSPATKYNLISAEV